MIFIHGLKSKTNECKPIQFREQKGRKGEILHFYELLFEGRSWERKRIPYVYAIGNNPEKKKTKNVEKGMKLI